MSPPASGPTELPDPGSPAPPPVAPGPPLSRLAVVAFAIAVIPCCPMTGLLGTLLGLMAMRRIAAAPKPVRGRRLALAAALIGMVTSFASLWGWERFARSYGTEQDTAIVSTIEGFVTAAIDGRLEDARARWDPQHVPTDDEIAATVSALAALGTFERVVVTSRNSAPFSLDVESSLSFRGSDGFTLGACRLSAEARLGSLVPIYRLQRLRLDRPGEEPVTVGAARTGAEDEGSDP